MLDWNPETIVAGLDGSEPSIAAADVAVSLAKLWKARLLLTTVVRPPEGWWGIGGAPPPPESLSTAIVDARRRILNEAEETLELDGVDYETIEEVGDPASRLIEICRANDAGLLVVGRRGAGLVERMMVGSVADRVTHAAPCPVLTVP